MKTCGQSRLPSYLTVCALLAFSAALSATLLSFDAAGANANTLRTHTGPDEASVSQQWEMLKKRRRRQLQAKLSPIVDAAASHSVASFSNFSCGDILYKTSAADVDSRCAYARTCNGGDGLLLPSVFCGASPNDSRYSYRKSALLSPALLLWLVLLFRMLGSTAEDFFAPSPEMLSRRLGLPPRFAGASLLALGNGAPDVSATVNALSSDPENGFDLALGALTGGGMFVGTVVAGCTILAAGGMPCRGALIRDVVAYALGVAVVMLVLGSGRVGGGPAACLFGFYGLFVAIVLAADVYHRTVVIPRARRQDEAKALDLQAQLMKMGSIRGFRVGALFLKSDEPCDEHSPLVGDSRPDASVSAHKEQLPTISETAHAARKADDRTRRIGYQVLSLMSNYDKNSFSLDKSLVMHGPDGILAKLSHQPRHPQPSLNGNQPNGLLSTADEAMATSGLVQHRNWLDLCTVRHGVWEENVRELRLHWQDFWSDLFEDESISLVEKILAAFELPFTIARKVSVPVPCEGYYCRPIVAISFALSPIWIGVYALSEYGVNLFASYSFPSVWMMCFPSFAAGLCIWVYADDKDMSLAAAGPIALYGFFVAATWIDFIANKLVSLLEFLGVILNIPSSVMGLTILAWGNSSGDLAANIALSRKGLANMAMTACFAGPLFNLVVGLGGGLLALKEEPQRIGKGISLSPAARTGFFFLVCNCIMIAVCGRVLSKGRIRVEYGYFMFGIYFCYIAASIAMEVVK